MKNYPDHLTSEYEMLECLASHDNSETLLASGKSDGKLYVVKLFFAESPLYDFTVPEEIKNLKHPNIPVFVDEYKSDDLRYEIREYIPGTPLDKLVRKKQLSLQDKNRITTQLCDILQYLHTKEVPVIHRDIKPQNIIISDSGKLFLIDFGIARTHKDTPEPSDTIICTTRDFSAPEQYGFMTTDNRSDIYSFGRVLKWLYNNDSKDIDHIISKCTAFDPDKRYSSIKEVRRALNRKAGLKRIIPASIAVFLLLACTSAVYLSAYNKHRFKEPLIEEAVRLSLGVGKLHPLTSSDLKKAETIYIVADNACSDSDEFYTAVNDWYSNDRKPEGKIISLEDCSKLSALRELCIAGEQITDISPLSGCTGLEKIEIKHNHVSDISVLKNMPELSSVGINGNPVTDISPLTGLQKLRYLDTCDVPVADPSIYEMLGDFEYLDIANGTTAYKYLSGKTIKKLRLGYIFTKDLAFLADINGLESVQLNFINYDNIQKLGNISFEVIYEGIDVPLKDPSYKKYKQNEEKN